MNIKIEFVKFCTEQNLPLSTKEEVLAASKLYWKKFTEELAAVQPISLEVGKALTCKVNHDR